MTLLEMGWNHFFEANQPQTPGVIGRVAMAGSERFLIWTESGEMSVSITGRLRHAQQDWPCVGDWVTIRDACAIEAVFPRQTKVSRKEPGKRTREQVLAANFDFLFIVTSLDRDYNPRRLERYLLLAAESGAMPIILLNKADLRDDVHRMVADAERVAGSALVLAVSALNGWGLTQLTKHVRPGQTAALIGSSGAGKSTLVNALCGEARQRTQEVRSSDAKGRHTTTHRELIAMPGGWLLIDMPGLRELQLWADPEQIDEAFSDIATLAAQCRFRDCKHQTEPGCAVLAAALDPQRLHSFAKIQAELAHLERQQDVLAASAAKKRWKVIHKAMRNFDRGRRFE